MSACSDDTTTVADTPVDSPAAEPAVKRPKVKKASNGASNGKAHKAKGKAKAKGKGKAVKAKGKARKPRQFDPAKLDPFGFRKGSLKSMAAAIYAKGKGATLAEVKEHLDSSQFNLLKQVEAAGFAVKRTYEQGNGNRKVTRYKIVAKK